MVNIKLLPKVVKHYLLCVLSILFFAKANYIHSQTPPNAQFTSNTNGCVYTALTFTNQSTAGSSPISTYTWDFGDGNSSNQQHATHIYEAPGTYTITLVVQAQNGQADSEVKVNHVTIYPKPTASFNMALSGCQLPVNVTFSNQSTGANTYQWNFGQGQNSTAQSPPNRTYSTTGNHSITLIATSVNGCKDTIVKPLTISNYTAAITAPETACVGQPVTISDNSTTGVNQYDWAFNGGAPAAGSSNSNQVTYSAPGTYTITLNSSNTSIGCTASATKEIIVRPAPTSTFTSTPLTGCSPLTVNFTNNSIQNGNSYLWTFDNGTTSTVANPSAVFTGEGTKNATLTVTNQFGCSTTSTQIATTLTRATAGLTANVRRGCADLDVTFTSTSTAPDPITSWQWNFGNGSTYNGETPPIQSYPVGIYSVTLIVSTDGGCRDTITMANYIEVGEIDQVNFSLFESPQCVKTDIDFTNESIINAPHDPNEITYTWNFGDGTNSSEENPTHQYSSSIGNFDVSLVIDFRGCKDSLVIEDAVFIKAPLSLFNLNQQLFCNPTTLPVEVQANDTSLKGEVSDNIEMIWKWGDGTTTNYSNAYLDANENGNATHNYSAYGTYTVEQVIHNYTTGCSDSMQLQINVTRVVASFGTFNLDSVCVGSPFNLYQASTSSHPFGTYQWSMGDGSTISGETPTYTYQQFGNYTIGLTATNNVGCSASTSYNSIRALALPRASFAANTSVGCAPFQVVLTNTSSPLDNGVPIASSVFNFSDNNIPQTTYSLSTPITHTFTTQGSFIGSLVVTDRFGCVSPPFNHTFTITKPTPAFSIDEVVCKNEDVVVSNTTNGVNPLSYAWYVNGNLVSTNPTHTASYTGAAGTSSTNYIYKLIATDANGCKDSVSHTVTVSTPLAKFNYTFSGASQNAAGDFTCPPVFAHMTDQSSSFGNITNYAWNFGDGKSSSLQNPSNTYVFPGSYSVTYRITDEYGCIDDTAIVNYLDISGPKGNPSWVQSTDQCGQLVTFDIIDTLNVASIVWQFGDNQTATNVYETTYQYQEIGSFYPSVILRDVNNCQVIYPMDTITIFPNGLNAAFTPSTVEADLGQEIIITDASSSTQFPITSWTWSATNYPTFTNGGSSFTIGYPIPGYYTVNLLIKDQNGCLDSYKATIHVTGEFNMPNVFTPNGDGVNDWYSFPYDIFDSYDMTIVNRWGNTIMHAKGMTGVNFWNGTTQSGDICPDGVYFYSVKGYLKDKTTFFEKEGFIQLFGK